MARLSDAEVLRRREAALSRAEHSATEDRAAYRAYDRYSEIAQERGLIEVRESSRARRHTRHRPKRSTMSDAQVVANLHYYDEKLKDREQSPVDRQIREEKRHALMREAQSRGLSY